MDDELSLREYQLKLLDLLTEFDQFCKENFIQYSLLGGTAIGAVRHQGFIPWDDDLDVGMDRENFEKIIALLKKSYEKYELIHIHWV